MGECPRSPQHALKAAKLGEDWTFQNSYTEF
jgi:hypothetical protein